MSNNGTAEIVARAEVREITAEHPASDAAGSFTMEIEGEPSAALRQMLDRTAALDGIPDNIEELYAKARQADAESCMKEINAALDKYKFKLGSFAQLGDQSVPINAILALRCEVQIISK